MPNSFTDEECCNFHFHGSVAVIAAMLEALNGMRPTQPGELTPNWISFMPGRKFNENKPCFRPKVHYPNCTMTGDSKYRAQWHTLKIDFSEDEDIEAHTERVQMEVNELNCDMPKTDFDCSNENDN